MAQVMRLFPGPERGAWLPEELSHNAALLVPIKPRTQPWPTSTRISSSAARATAQTSAVSGLDGSRLPALFEELLDQSDLDRILADAAANDQLVLIDWMAQWCRKCIYLKPKIEKLVHEYPSVRFCVVDVNKVPFSLVKSANISKMPTLQLWGKGALLEEMIGGEAAWQVIDKLREMIKRNL